MNSLSTKQQGGELQITLGELGTDMYSTEDFM